MDSQLQTLKEEMQEMRKNYNNSGGDHGSKNDDTPMYECHEVNYIQSEDYHNRNSHDSYSHQYHHDPNYFKKSLAELNNDVNKARVIMSSATSAVTYTSVYTDSEPGRAFWGADDEEVSEGGIPWVIVLGYDGLPIQPVSPPSPDYILGPEDPQTPPVPQDKDEREPMFVHAHDLDYVPEPIYPEYIPL
ncbi:hypothetical protein Tco_0647955, partial [Tanacetum coccineum]